MRSKGLWYFDADGMVLDSIGAVLKCFSIIDGVDYTNKTVKKWNFEDAIPHIKEIDVENIFASDLFWREVKFIDGAYEFIKENQDRIVIVSIGDYRNQLQKIAFFNKHFPHIAMIPIITKVNKDRIIGKDLIRMTEHDAFLEDSASNLNESMAGTKILFNDKDMWDCEWNKNICTKHIKATNYEHIRKILEHYNK